MSPGVRPASPVEGNRPPYPWLKRYPEGVNWSASFEPLPVPALLDRAVQKYAARPCTTFLGKTLSYGEIGQRADKAAAGLQRLGVGKGTKVGLFLPNAPTFLVYYYGIIKAGGTVVNYNPLYTLEELSFQLKDSQTELLVTLDLKLLFDKVEALLQAGSLRRAIIASFPALLPATKSVLFKLFKGKDLARPEKSPVASRLIFDADLTATAGEVRPVAIDPGSDVAVLQYTGGTTGTPKGAMLTHANIFANVVQTEAFMYRTKMRGEARYLLVIPY